MEVDALAKGTRPSKGDPRPLNILNLQAARPSAFQDKIRPTDSSSDEEMLRSAGELPPADLVRNGTLPDEVHALCFSLVL